MAKEKKESYTERELMELAIEVMDRSVNEPRADGKVPPKVGAVLLFPDGSIETAYRGELREGDHGEYTLIERKLVNKNLEGSILFTTLEPCVERNSPKVPCCRRTTNARIKKVYVGIIDPDPTVSTKGIKHLEHHGVEVKMFDKDLQKIIEQKNKAFLDQALERKRASENDIKEQILNPPLERAMLDTSFDDLSAEALQKFIIEAKLPYKIEQPEFQKYLRDLGVLVYDSVSNTYKANSLGILLFGLNPRLKLKQAALKCTANIDGYELKPESFDQALVLIPDLVEEWLKKALGETKDTTSFKRQSITNFPIQVLREAVINAIVHRDYEIEGAKNSIYIDKERIVIKSPGGPPSAISLEQLNTFKAPSISRNPIITYVFNLMGYVEETGLGMVTLRTLYEEYGLPLPEYTSDPPFLVLTFPRTLEAVKSVSHHVGLEELNKAQLNGYEWLKTAGEVSTREYSAHFDIGYKTAQRHLAKMKELGLIRDNGEDPNSPNFKYVVR